MKIFFIRHGEAMDDIEDKYGGWYDPDLSPAGIKGAKKVAEKLLKMNLKFDLILSSPLKRAIQTAEEISRVLRLPMETFVYLKERNTYGLLCGQNKKEAREKYPDLVNAYDQGKEVLGYEEYDFFLKRVRVLIEKLSRMNSNILICLTHRKLLKALFKDILAIKAKEFHDNCIVEVNLDHNGNLKLLSSQGVDLE